MMREQWRYRCHRSAVEKTDEEPAVIAIVHRRIDDQQTQTVRRELKLRLAFVSAGSSMARSLRQTALAVPNLHGCGLIRATHWVANWSPLGRALRDGLLPVAHGPTRSCVRPTTFSPHGHGTVIGAECNVRGCRAEMRVLANRTASIRARLVQADDVSRFGKACLDDQQGGMPVGVEYPSAFQNRYSQPMLRLVNNRSAPPNVDPRHCAVACPSPLPNAVSIPIVRDSTTVAAKPARQVTAAPSPAARGRGWAGMN
jgi:hypothetical protein